MKELADMLFYLTNYHRYLGEFDQALEYANRLALLGGIEKQEALRII